MFCTKCGAQVADSAKFCTQCGAPVADSQQPEFQADPAVQQEPVCAAPTAPETPTPSAQAPDYSQFAPPQTAEPTQETAQQIPGYDQYGQTPDYNNYASQQIPNYSGYGQPPVYGEPPVPEAPRKKRTALFLTLGAVAVICVVALAAGFMTNWFGYTGPLNQITKALNNTSEAQNMTMDMEVTVAGETVQATMAVDMDRENREFTMLVTMQMYGEDITYAFYDNQMIVSMGEYCYAEDMSDEMEEIWGALEDTGTQISLTDIDWKDLAKDLDIYDDIKDHIDFDELNQCVAIYARHLNSSSWLEENAGYSKSGGSETVYQFDLPIIDFLIATAEDFEPVFKDSDDYDTLLDELKDMEDEFDDIQMVLSIGVSDDMLRSLKMEVSGISEVDTISIEATFSKIGSTKIDTGALEEMVQKASESGY